MTTPIVNNDKYPMREISIDYGVDGNFTIYNLDPNNKVLKFVGVFKGARAEEMVKYNVRQVSSGVYMIWWYECRTSNIVHHVENFNTNTVYSTIFDRVNSIMYATKGNITNKILL
ncbi:hypothetical protein [Trichoplusia ni ascovirus 2c]|uniref:hypothetical protein n=1 Tax=Trichoplusia ni ascovirus 2c TaxID=328615 RepID=UPI0000E441F9|nr:hypothetical protein TNAV2c_gp033 [Trichoplusia ni ascovirus 2c]ABF70550.1 hypothetical protein [Trichoplusia ni ascovirus 2c]AUS94136.1 MBL fold hydrolase [Trichoplusia ni ascovirus 6b]